MRLKLKEHGGHKNRSLEDSSDLACYSSMGLCSTFDNMMDSWAAVMAVVGGILKPFVWNTVYSM